MQNLYEQLIDGSTDRAAYLSQKQKITAQLQELTEKEAELKAAASASELDASGALSTVHRAGYADTGHCKRTGAARGGLPGQQAGGSAELPR